MAIKVTMNLVVWSLVVVAVALVQGSRAATHVVGGNSGWAIPSNDSSNPNTWAANYYTTWALNQTFAVGDVLLFNYTTGEHDVVVAASKTAYDSCSSTNALSTQKTGPTSITLTSGEHFYFCSVGTHCTQGQKLAISVSTNATSGQPLAVAAALPVTLVSIFVALLY